MNGIPIFKLALVNASTHEQVFHAGGPVELDLVRAIVDAVATHRVGWTQSQATVLREVEAAVQEALYAFKASVTP